MNGHEYTKPIKLESWNGANGGGVYVFMYMSDSNNYHILYVGETGEFDTRNISNHEKLSCCKKNSNDAPLYICTLRKDDKSERCSIEKSIISITTPPCNDEYT